MEHNIQDLSQSLMELLDRMDPKLISGLLNSASEESIFAVSKDVLIEGFMHLNNHLLTLTKETSFHILQSNNEIDSVIIEIICKDIPFLIDSISNHLRAKQFDVDLMLSCTFDKDNNQYIIIQFYASKLCIKDELNALPITIGQIIECASFAVMDWDSMQNKLLSMNHFKDHDIKHFVKWLLDDKFIFLGYCASNEGEPDANCELGIFRSGAYDAKHIASIKCDEASELIITRWHQRSVIHRSSHMDWLVVSNVDSESGLLIHHHFVGFFTSSVYYESVLDIPLISNKVQLVAKQYNYAAGSHQYKDMITLLEAMPRGELLQMSSDELLQLGTKIVPLMTIPKARIYIRENAGGHFVTCMTFLPGSRMSSELTSKINDKLCEMLSGSISKYRMQLISEQLACIHTLIYVNPENRIGYDHQAVYSAIKAISEDWIHNLQAALLNKYDKNTARYYIRRYGAVFTTSYMNDFSIPEAILDIEIIEQGVQEEQVQFRACGTIDDIITIKIYCINNELSLSNIIPNMENMGLSSIDEMKYQIHINHDEAHKEATVYIHAIRLKHVFHVGQEHISALESNVIEALYMISNGLLENNHVNKLLCAAILNARQIALLQAMTSYLKQISFMDSDEYIAHILAKYASIVSNIVHAFYYKFSLQQANGAIDERLNLILASLNEVSSIAEEKILRSYIFLVRAIVRTNFFQLDKENMHKRSIALKIMSKDVLEMPDPRPHIETYVYCPNRFEAIHLRGSDIARGGLRWSDRSDFRTEVLGLMKAQMTKNSIIVPSGAKGGFLLKRTDASIPSLDDGIICYKLFLSSILDITDNIVAGKVIKPAGVICYDEDDPYLVVAADKGTATFSDYANQVSIEYNYWLGDAFASGGSNGYDHKKLGITAKGAWISVANHFATLAMHPDQDEFTVIGIGDMSGDVFGNGMLLSSKLKLIGAFNHKHIFLDPSPNPEQSYKERERLFNLQRSQWSDYDPEVISEGGGVYERAQKYITISTQVQAMLDLQDSVVTPDALITAMLKARVDLIWNGGIGTYVKATNEYNEAIKDKSNDSVRVNGAELRCRIIGEGGNLGMTQLGRIEYAKNGGLVNTDFIDNSAGVDCSDHEVNIKIALNSAIYAGKTSLEERNKLLSVMTNEVSKLVLNDNDMQNKLIDLEQYNACESVDTHSWLIRYLEEFGGLDRDIEQLPSNDVIMIRKAEGLGLTRPEIAVISAYSKNAAALMLKKYDTKAYDDFNDDILSYFPKQMVVMYKDEILHHPLKKHIFITVIINDFINLLGICFFHQLIEAGYHADEIIKAYIIIRKVLDTASYFNDPVFNNIDIPKVLKMELYTEIQHAIHGNIERLLRLHNGTIEDVTACTVKYSRFMEAIRDIQSDLSRLDIKADARISKQLARVSIIVRAIDVMEIAHRTNSSIQDVVECNNTICKDMHLDWLILRSRNCPIQDYHDYKALNILVGKLQDLHFKLTETTVKSSTRYTIFADPINCPKAYGYRNFIERIKLSNASWVSSMVIVLQYIEHCMV